MAMVYRQYVLLRLRDSLLASAFALAATGWAFAQTPESESLATDGDQWSEDAITSVLQDGSSLNEYRALTEDQSGKLSTLIIGFHPRFDCQPRTQLSVPRDSVKDYTSGKLELRLAVGEQVIQWPVIVDVVGDLLWFSSSEGLDGQRALRDALDGNVWATIGFSESMVLEFSLQGSRSSASIAEENCMRHMPVEWSQQ